MNNGTIKSTIQGDKTILLYGRKLNAKYRDRPHLLAHVAEKMREVARLLIAAKKKSSHLFTIKTNYSTSEIGI
ncbi:Pesticidal crystal protein Cry9Ca [Frankliniella fusca]|uniref:Pesticidal crystal protein Cry9Ca n=1 Tax=Frankliniella fusca TaxID=407009 RepID=A0AAE1GX66_9NEOP|nr:Pesticidal crystal protein Cry9Ca [Frankliniella fusca]